MARVRRKAVKKRRPAPKRKAQAVLSPPPEPGEIMEAVLRDVLANTEDYRLTRLYEIGRKLDQVSSKLNEACRLLNRVPELQAALAHIMIKLPGGGNG